ncbi:MAG: hypothetical protein GKS07_07140 [Nitrosopumilus sp.]|nr:MAG: hypothetical protein GKS07_07140 [Nitrosopumilus sp.]
MPDNYNPDTLDKFFVSITHASKAVVALVVMATILGVLFGLVIPDTYLPGFIFGSSSLPDVVSESKLSKNMANKISEKISYDIGIIEEYVDSALSHNSFTYMELLDPKIVSCDDTSEDVICDEMAEIKDKTNSHYNFIFAKPGQEINNGLKTENCEIERIVIDSIGDEIKNEWLHRQWCDTKYNILLTNQYSASGDDYHNVNSLLTKYVDKDGYDVGIVNAYNLEKLVKEYMDESVINRFNTIVLDANGCVAAAVSKDPDNTTIKLDDSVWQIQKNGTILDLFPNFDGIRNCPDVAELDMDNHEEYLISLKINSEDESNMDGPYYRYEMEEFISDDPTKNTNVFKNWSILISLN